MDLKPEKDLKYFKRSENRIHLDFLYAIQSRIKEGGNLAGMENATSIPSSEIIVWYDTVCSKDFDFGAAIMLQIKNGLHMYLCKPLILLVRPARFELATYGFVVKTLSKMKINDFN